MFSIKIFDEVIAVHIYEINTWTWLNDLSRKEKRAITLDSVPEDALASIQNMGIDAIWLMGVWERSPKGRKIALEHPDLQAEYRRVLPDFVPEDVVGSPYAVHRYEVDPHLGGRVGLINLRQRLKKMGIQLILDFVPNHVALDHPWLMEFPDAFVQGTVAEQTFDPKSFFRAGQYIFAHGRDPYYPAWTDTAQANAFSKTYRRLATETLLEISSLCDGVRCDMAMLLTNEIFAKTWSLNRVGAIPSQEFWVEIIQAVKHVRPEFFFIAEVYWDMEFTLQQQGFDYCYDKRFYDRVVHDSAGSINAHLQAELSYQQKLVRFIENHDEPRAITTLGLERSKMAAVLIATLPGAKLWHEGQFQGHKIKLPVQLGRRPKESSNAQLYAFYRKLLVEAQDSVYQLGAWVRRNVIPAWPGNESNGNLIAYTWEQGNDRRLIVVNYSNTLSQGRVPITNFGLEPILWKLTDVLNNAVYEREGHRMVTDGLYIELEPFHAHIFHFEPIPS
ncbi:MAG: alpha-amylase [Phototrophicales bacterium]|nr:MAG: alpha-amylase [Phototrophicales bacterium]